MGDVVDIYLLLGGLVGWLLLWNGKNGMEIYWKAWVVGIGIVFGMVFFLGDWYDIFLWISLGLFLIDECILVLV